MNVGNVENLGREAVQFASGKITAATVGPAAERALKDNFPHALGAAARAAEQHGTGR